VDGLRHPGIRGRHAVDGQLGPAVDPWLSRRVEMPGGSHGHQDHR
jgi:hypothetical protein